VGWWGDRGPSAVLTANPSRSRSHELDYPAWDAFPSRVSGLAAVIEHGEELLAIAQRLGVRTIGLCGSVARGEDGDQSDLDFYVSEFDEPESGDARSRATQLVREFRRVLDPIKVDIRGIPGWLVDPEPEDSMRRDSIDLRQLLHAEP
jgi:predicted nucleotidyltransferase